MSSLVKITTRPQAVLVVNPDLQGREKLISLLRNANGPALHITEAAGVADALSQFHKHHQDLILISATQLPSIGAEIAKYVRASEGNRHTGLIFVDDSLQGDQEQILSCLEMGADDFLRKDTTAAEIIARVRAVLRLKEMTDQLRSANHKLRLLSLTDELTGLGNMRQFNIVFAKLLRSCRQGKSGVGVLMLDLDHFKSVNDTTNHLIGSFVISATGKLLQGLGLFNSNDIQARYGGDEFIIACAVPNLAALEATAEKLRHAISSTTFERDGHSIRITSSIGVAYVERGFRGRAEDLIKAADNMLYKSKNAGRNRVTGMTLKYQLDLVSEPRLSLTRPVPASLIDTESSGNEELPKLLKNG